MTKSSPHERRIAYFAWLTVCIVWGTTYLAIRIALESMPPTLMSGLRWVLAGSLLAGALMLRGERLPKGAQWRGVIVLAFLLLGLGNTGVAWAEHWLPSGLTAVIVASGPFWMTGVEALRRDGEALTGPVVSGLVVGFAGICLLVWPDLVAGGARGRGFIAGLVSLQIACLGWAIGSSYSRRHARGENVFSTSAGQMLAGGVMMIVAASLRGEWAMLHFTPRTTAAFLYLSTIGAIGGFVAYVYALRHLPVSLVSLYAYVNPIIAVVLGVLLLGEPFTWRMVLAAALVFAGVATIRLPQMQGTRVPAPRTERV